MAALLCHSSALDSAVITDMLQSQMKGVLSSGDIDRILRRADPRHLREMGDWLLEVRFCLVVFVRVSTFAVSPLVNSGAFSTHYLL
jgi:hypothetical protein